MKTLLPLLLAAVCLPAAAQSMEPGEWQFTTTLTSSMAPGAQTSTFTECVSKADAADPTRFTGKDQTAGCQVTPGERSPESYSWTVSCPAQGMRGSGKVRFSYGTIESDMQVSADMQGQKIEMRTRLTGRRLGPCTPK